MDELNLNKILNREEQEKAIKNVLKDFESNKNNLKGYLFLDVFTENDGFK
jgi:hypothetical protein